jgi:hypothetical protein
MRSRRSWIVNRHLLPTRNLFPPKAVSREPKADFSFPETGEKLKSALGFRLSAFGQRM